MNNNTKEDLLFEMFKDTVATGTELRRKELQNKYPDVNISNLHIRIVNYQVKNYGASLNNKSLVREYEQKNNKGK